MKISITGTKKTDRKPYLAKLAPGNKREFAKRTKATNTSYSFHLDDLAAGDVIEFRASVWTGEGYTSDRCHWAIVTEADCVLVARSLARRAVELAAAGNPVKAITGSDFAGDLSGGLTAEEEAKLRAEAGGDFIAVKLADGSLFLPEPADESEAMNGTVRGQAWRLATVWFCDCQASAADADSEEDDE